MDGGSESGWIELSARLQRIAASRTGRTDLVVRAAPYLEHDATAWSGWYHHSLAEIRLPAAEVVDAPSIAERIDPSVEAGRDAQPRLAGALFLASTHAAHTTWSRNEQDGATLAACIDLMERCRVAGLLLAERPGDRRWLRAVTPLLVPGSATWQSLALLGLHMAGVLTAQESHVAHEYLLSTFDSARVAQLQQLLRSALRLPDGDSAALRELARRVATLLGADAGEPDAPAEPSPDVQAMIDTIGRGSPRARPTRRSIMLSEDDLMIAERELARAAAAQSFGERSAPAQMIAREPDARLRFAAHALAGQLRRARYRDADTLLLASGTPPGRLRLAEAMRREAQRAAGVEITARPWLKLRRRILDEPPLRVGLSWDISRSQSPLHSRMADLAWSLAWAVHHIDGRVAAVAWNSTAHAVHWPGRVAEAVIEPPCGGTSSGCPQSLRALADALDLQTPGGTRLVVIATDGHVPNRRAIGSEIDLLVRYGVTLLWVTPLPDPNSPRGAVSVVLGDPDKLVQTLGCAVRHVLARATT